MNGWYKDIKKAPWTPPSYVFGIVWTILYILMGVSFMLVFLDNKCYPYCSPLNYFLMNYNSTMLSFDIGIRNMSYCFIKTENK